MTSTREISDEIKQVKEEIMIWTSRLMNAFSDKNPEYKISDCEAQLRSAEKRLTELTGKKLTSTLFPGESQEFFAELLLRKKESSEIGDDGQTET